MAGTISLSMTQQLDQFGDPLAGGKLYLIQAGTVSTPQNGFQDSALTLPWPNPIVMSASGRLPQFWLADGSIKIRMTDVNGVEILVADGIIVTGASSGGGGGSPVDATTVLATGDIKSRYGTGVLTGFVRCNARTIGSATSGASERANADTQALFEYLWNTDVNLTVSSGRGATSIADWSANKTIALPDGRNRALASLGDMGNSDAALFTGATFASGNGITLGSRLGIGTPRTILRTDLPNVAPTFTGTLGNASATSANIVFAGQAIGNPGGSGLFAGGGVVGTLTSTYTPVGTVQSLNGGVTQTTFDTVSPYLLITTYIKL